ncbi:curli-like amyloid fiber formation chaperone CsgH [Devosia sp. RR2S18]|uniref:curli-like amyloid fiber formation chaperone CsgH n=1 Tax=Devosia rhizosphaerae TaxID=3049774 RepID=UPI002540CBD6|nr:curli-like amyloid fiber formation chaperone CsgH [Devosia sp. RR2S18]WIJ23933.1 curli-like amyloid fiber formation chaperone CsgH [Devosia sp. RR2S18]
MARTVTNVREAGLLLAVLGAAAFAQASSGVPFMLKTSNESGVRCGVQERLGNGMVEIRGIAVSDSMVSGDYSFEVVQEGRGGRSVNRQAGSFSLQPGVETILGTAIIGANSYHASLVIVVDGVTIDCSRQA